MQERPVYLDLTKISLPLSAFLSITHRLSGMYVFFITLPLLLILIYSSTTYEWGFNLMIEKLSIFSFFSFFVFISISIFWYHILTGVRHLIMDLLHIGESLKGAHYSSIIVIAIWVLTSFGYIGYLFI
ncbi:MAG: succinate dehydrogenase, cytochrome b556 subunit [Gammaproteobacteria bacterium]|nr:succinate dehydrogenase, cytochrome b556 subunit [Gammaproteobacteria bacterium]